MKGKESKEMVKTERPSYLAPIGELERWFEEALRRPFSLFERPLMWPEGRRVSLSVDVFESDDHLVVKAELPGLEKKDIDIHLTEDMLTIAGEKKKEEKLEEKDYYRYERSYGSFTRRIPLPVRVQTDKATAHFEKGILEIRIPKTEEAKRKEKKVLID